MKMAGRRFGDDIQAKMAARARRIIIAVAVRLRDIMEKSHRALNELNAIEWQWREISSLSIIIRMQSMGNNSLAATECYFHKE